MKKLFYICILMSLGFVSCKKLGKDEISGVVQQDSTFCLLPGVDVQLYEFHDFSVSNAEFRASATTDANGKYTIYYNLRHRNPYFLRFAKTGYWTGTHTISTTDDLKNINVILNDM